jgi:hypothetical protein
LLAQNALLINAMTASEPKKVGFSELFLFKRVACYFKVEFKGFINLIDGFLNMLLYLLYNFAYINFSQNWTLHLPPSVYQTSTQTYLFLIHWPVFQQRVLQLQMCLQQWPSQLQAPPQFLPQRF